MRNIPEVSVSALMEKFNSHFGKLRKRYGLNAKLEYTAKHDGWFTDSGEKVVRKLMKATGLRELHASFGGDDGTYFANAGIPVACYGCGNNSRHRSNEYVDIGVMKAVGRDMVRFLEIGDD